MTQKELTQASVAYRKYRERCGIKDPVMLDEIEEAYFKGAEETFAIYFMEVIDKSSESIEDVTQEFMDELIKQTKPVNK